MISTKKQIKIARKWQRMAALGGRRRRLSLIPRRTNIDSSYVADKGHFVIYTAAKVRFMVPLEYLYNQLIQQLFKISEDEFGFSSGGPITVPCDAAFMEYMMSLIQRGLANDLEKAVLNIVASTNCSLLAASENENHLIISTQLIVCVH